MKMSALFKIIVKEFKKDIFISVFLFVLVDFIYVNFTGVELNKESGPVLWQGGNDSYMFGLNTVLLKLLNVSIVFIMVGKIADKISSDIMVYILVRVTDYKKFICAYSTVLIILGETLLIIYIILNNCYSLENSFMYIIAVYLLNTVLPVPILPAMSTVRFFILKNQIALVPLLLMMAGIDLLVVIYYYVLIKRRRINIC